MDKKEGLVSLFGIGWAIFMGLLLGLLEFATGFSLFSLFVFFLVPIGAVICGAIASWGFYLGANYKQHKPSGNLMFNMIAAAISVYFMANYTMYFLSFYSFSFWEYLDAIIHSSNIKVGFWGKGIEGYSLAFVQLAGFVVGGLWTFEKFENKKICKACKKRFSKVGKHKRFLEDKALLGKKIKQFRALLEKDKLQEAVDFHHNDFGEKKAKAGRFSTQVTLYNCQSCGINRLDFVAKEKADRKWEEIPEYKFYTLFSEEVY